jgi:two-component system, NtrC family, response regulator AtoC
MVDQTNLDQALTRKHDYDLESVRKQVAPEGHRLRVVSESNSFVYQLPTRGTVQIGRESDSEVCIESPEVSRAHARIHLGETIELEDLGSSNGTIVCGEQLASKGRTLLYPGDLIEIGQFTIFVQEARMRSSGSRVRRILPHGYFESRVETECARANRIGTMFAVGRLHLERDFPSEKLLTIFAEVLRGDDELACYAPREFEFLLSDASVQRVDRINAQLGKKLEDAGVSDSFRIGMAVFPRDARSSENLIAIACDAIRNGDADPETAQTIVVEDESMIVLHRLLEKIAKGSISVLILGETGVGKEIAAELIHRKSRRADHPLIRLNCAALSENLIESELFGYEKGAFTGAMRSKPGLLETAEGGTIFLDEVGELPLSTQVKLLRVLEERKVLRVGGLEAKAIDVRIMSATNRDLALEIEEGRFRQDLFFRLNGISVTVPPLRNRAVEISGLAKLFVTQICELDQRADLPTISSEAMHWLESYAWPGNIRELRNVIERAVLLADEGRILPEHLPLENMNAPLLTSTQVDALEADGALKDHPTDATPRKKLLGEIQDFEKNRIIEALMTCDGNQTKAAKMLGIARRTLIKRLDLYGIPRPRKKVPVV